MFLIFLCFPLTSLSIPIAPQGNSSCGSSLIGKLADSREVKWEDTQAKGKAKAVIFHAAQLVRLRLHFYPPPPPSACLYGISFSHTGLQCWLPLWGKSNVLFTMGENPAMPGKKHGKWVPGAWKSGTNDKPRRHGHPIEMLAARHGQMHTVGMGGEAEAVVPYGWGCHRSNQKTLSGPDMATSWMFEISEWTNVQRSCTFSALLWPGHFWYPQFPLIIYGAFPLFPQLYISTWKVRLVMMKRS